MPAVRLQLRLDFDSIIVRLQFNCVTTIDDLRYVLKPTCVRAAAMKPK